MTATLDPPGSELVTLSVTSSEAGTRVTAVGEIDSSSAPIVRDELDGILAAGPAEVVVDLGGVTFLDSAGLCVLAAAHRRAAADGVQLRVLASSRAVIRPLQITGLWELLGVERVQPVD